MYASKVELAPLAGIMSDTYAEGHVLLDVSPMFGVCFGMAHPLLAIRDDGGAVIHPSVPGAEGH